MDFKQLTTENWRQPDATAEATFRISPLVGPVEMDGDAWARQFLAVELKGHVPEQVRDLFDVARACLLYGWFFYPLFHLGEEQLFRISEAAAGACYARLGGPVQEPRFAEAVRWLIGKGAIAAEDEDRWTAMRELRNIASHPRRQSVMPPGQALRTLTAVAHDINRLFARAAALG